MQSSAPSALAAPTPATSKFANRDATKALTSKDLTGYFFEALLVLAMLVLLGHTAVNYGVKHAVHDELSQMKNNLYALKETIHSIDNAYDDLQDDIDLLAQIKERETRIATSKLNKINKINSDKGTDVKGLRSSQYNNERKCFNQLNQFIERQATQLKEGKLFHNNNNLNRNSHLSSNRHKDNDNHIKEIKKFSTQGKENTYTPLYIRKSSGYSQFSLNGKESKVSQCKQNKLPYKNEVAL